MTNETIHRSVLTAEMKTALAVKSGGTYLDGTFGGGGHSAALLEASYPDGKVVALDRDPMVEPRGRQYEERYPGRLVFHQMSYHKMKDLNKLFDGIVLDLGMSSDQLSATGEPIGRGFSFSRDEPLDMRFDPTSGASAAMFLRQASLLEITRMLSELAQDRYSLTLARKIVETRRTSPIKTTTDLVRVIGNSNPKVLAPIFQAIRISVNRELEILKAGLLAAKECLRQDGRLAVITFHSVEDRIVKSFFRENNFELVTKKPIAPSEDELQSNPSSRSAHLRAGIIKEASES